MRFARLLVVFSLAPACAGTAPPPAQAPPAASCGPHAPVASNEQPRPAGGAAPDANSLAEADAIERDALAVPGRDDRFSVDRQVSELERAIALYRQFLERAGEDPRFVDAVKRSRDRISDAEQTIAFLRQQAQGR